MRDATWRKGLEDARRQYRETQTAGPVQVVDGYGTISPREAFELWAYGEHLHDDEAKIVRMDAMTDYARAIVRLNAVGYMDMLARAAAYTRSAIVNDAGLK